MIVLSPLMGSIDMEALSSLVRAAQGGDLGAFDEIVGRFQDMAYASAYSMLGDAQLAEDAAQEAFLEAYLNLAKLHEPAAFPGWFRRIVFKQGDRLTRGKHIPTMPLENAFDMPLADLNPATVVERRETNLRVRRAIDELPDHERTVTLLFYSTGYALKDIAAFLEVPVTTIKKRLHDARKHLKESLVDVVRDTLHEQRRSMMDGFPDKVRLLIAIHMGDIAGVSALLERNAMLVNTKAEWDEQVVRHYGWIGGGLNPLYEAARGGPDKAFYFVGGVDEAIAKAGKEETATSSETVPLFPRKWQRPYPNTCSERHSSCNNE